jgi:hypothetical protein
MDLIDDLRTDLAIAFLIEPRYVERIRKEDVLDLIGRIQTALVPIARTAEAAAGGALPKNAQAPNSH